MIKVSSFDDISSYGGGPSGNTGNANRFIVDRHTDRTEGGLTG